MPDDIRCFGWLKNLVAESLSLASPQPMSSTPGLKRNCQRSRSGLLNAVLNAGLPLRGSVLNVISKHALPGAGDPAGNPRTLTF